jgi:hypothetical protein
MGSYGAGFIFRAGLGGALYDRLGFVAPFGVSAGLALIGLLLAAVFVPETRRPIAQSEAPEDGSAQERRLTLASVPRPLHVFFALVTLDFTASSASPCRPRTPTLSNTSEMFLNGVF